MQNKILIKKLKPNITSEKLVKNLFDLGLKPKKIEIIFDKITQKSLRKAIVEMQSDEDAKLAVSGGIYVIDGNQVEMEIINSL